MYFLQTNSFWDPNLMSLIDGIKSILPNDSFVSTAKEIAAVLALIYLSVRAYAMIVGEGKLEVMQLFRPFIITLVIVNFGTYAAIVDMPGKATGNKAQANFEANAKDGIAIPWPVNYNEIAPWYDHVEKFAGISGSKEGLAHLPDGQFLPAIDLNIVEKDVAARIKEKFKGETLLANLRKKGITVKAASLNGLAEEAGDLLFELLVDILRAANEPDRGHAIAVAVHRGGHRSESKVG